MSTPSGVSVCAGFGPSVSRSCRRVVVVPRQYNLQLISRCPFTTFRPQYTDDVLSNSPFHILQNISANPVKTHSSLKSNSVHDLNLDYLRNRSQDSPFASKPKASSSELPIERPPRNPKEVNDWASKCQDLAKSRKYMELENVLRQGDVEGYDMDSETFGVVMSQLFVDKQHHMVVYMFNRFQLTEMADNWVINAITSTYAVRDHAACEAIFSKYLGKVDFPVDTLNTVLKNFYAQTNPLVAKEFLSQIWDQANEKTMSIAFKNLAKISQDPEEIVSLMYRFKEDRGVISEHLYATVLECLLDLGNSDLMIEVTRTIEADGLFATACVQEVILQQLLIEKNKARIEAYLMLFEQQNAINVTSRPFERAAIHFSRAQDTNGILSIVNWMSHCNLNITTPVMNAFLSTVLRSGNATKLIDNIDGWSQLGVVGSNATVNLIWNGLLKKYPDHGKLITTRLKSMGKEYPMLYKGLSADTFSIVEMQENVNADSNNFVVLPTSPDKNSTLYALRHVQELNRNNRSQLGIEVIDDLLRRNVKPTPQIFSTVLHGLCKAGLSDEFDVALKKIEDCGYTPEPMLKLIFLRTHLLRMRGNSTSLSTTYTQKLLAVQRLKQFAYEHRNVLNLKMVTSIGYELLYFQEIDYAISMFNYFRKPGSELNSSCHDNETLCGLVKAYLLKGQFHEIVQLVKELVRRDESGNGSGIVTRPRLEWQLRECVIKAKNMQNKVIETAMNQQIELVHAYRTGWVEQDLERSLESVHSIFEDWEKKLTPVPDMKDI